MQVRRPGAPGERTLQHILGVSELYVALAELGRTAGFTVAGFEAEPGCWWPNGLGGYVKPDAYPCWSAVRYGIIGGSSMIK